MTKAPRPPTPVPTDLPQQYLRLIRVRKRRPEDPKRHPKRTFAVFLVAMGVLAAVFAYLNWDSVETVILDVQPVYILAAAALALGSTTLTGFGFASFARIFGVQVPLRELGEVGYISVAFGRFVAFTSVPGYSMRIMLTRRWGAAPEAVLAASLVHSIANDLILFALVPVGLTYVILAKQVFGVQLLGLLLVISIFVLMILGWLLFAFSHSVRRPILAFVTRLWKRITKHDITARVQDLDHSLSTGTAYLRLRPKLLEVPLAIVAVDWCLAMAALWTCFFAFGIRLDPGELITGFSLGMFAAYASNLPGGLGVMEGSMAGVFSYFDVVSFEQAALAALLYRVVYYVIPFVVSLAFYWRHLRLEKRQAPAAIPA